MDSKRVLLATPIYIRLLAARNLCGKLTGSEVGIEQRLELAATGSSARAYARGRCIEYFVHGIGTVTDGLFNDVAWNAVAKAHNLTRRLAAQLPDSRNCRVESGSWAIIWPSASRIFLCQCSNVPSR